MNIKDNFSLFGMIEFPDVLSLLNLLCGMISVLFAVEKEFTLAAVFMLVAVFFGLIYGRIANFMKKDTHFGRELASLAGLGSFGVAPVLLAFQTTKGIGEGWIFAAIIYMVFIAAAALRHARANLKETKYFEGMPSLVNGLIVPVFYFVGLTSWYPFIFLVSAILMISAFRLRKLF